MSIYHRRQTSVEAFQVPFPIDIICGPSGVVRANTNDWVIRDERNRTTVMSNEDFASQFETNKMPSVQRSPGVNSRVIAPEDIESGRQSCCKVSKDF